MVSAIEAESVASGLLADELPRRWAHTIGVATRAREVGPVVAAEAEVLEAAAWLHDIGYASSIKLAGFHPLDGARYLRDELAMDEVVCRLVAHHTCAGIEAHNRGVDGLADEFPPPDQELLDALTYCDLTAGVDGRPVEVEDRLEEILSRYPSGHVVHHSISQAKPILLATVQRMRRRLADI